MAQLKDLLVDGKSRFIDKIYASDQFISKVAQGTSPLLVDSSTLVTNLNADLLDGYHYSAFSLSTHTHTWIGDGGMKMYAHNNNEVNFGGTNNSSTIYFGYRALDSKPIPSNFVFGGSAGTANVKAKQFFGDLSTNYLVPIKEKTYSNYTCAAADTNSGYIFYAYVTPTESTIWQKPWRVHYTLQVDTSVNECQGYYDIYIGYAGSTVIYHLFNRFYSTSYRPLYYHTAAYHNTAAKFSSYRTSQPVRLGARVTSAYGANTIARTYTIKVWEEYGCTVTFPSAIETYGNVYSTTYYGLSELPAYNQGLAESWDDNDTTTTQLYYTRLKAGTNGIKQYSLVMMDASGNWQSFITDSGAGSTHTKNTVGFVLGSPIYYMNLGSNIAAGSYPGYGSARAYTSLVDFRYSLSGITANGTDGTGLTAYKPVYLVGTVGRDGLFYIDDTMWVHDIPTTENGKIYIKLTESVYPDYGENSKNYRGDLLSRGYAYYYKDGKILRYGESNAQNIHDIEGAVNHFGQHVTLGDSSVSKDPTNNGYYATGNLRRVYGFNFNGYTIWTVSGYFKAASAINVSINLCDRTSNPLHGEQSSSVALTTEYVYHKFTYDNVNQYNTSSAYNGFLDIEGSSDVVVYVKDLMIEKGYVAHEYRPSLIESSNLGYIGTTAVKATSGAYQDLTGIGTVYIQGTQGTYREGIRIKPYSSWSTIMLGGNDLTADSGTSTNSWGLFNNNGNFYLTKGASSTVSAAGAMLSNVSNNWNFAKGTLTSSNQFTAAARVIFSGLDTGSSDVTDGTEILTSYASNNGFADSNGTGIVYRRQASKLYNYIKSKTDLIYAKYSDILDVSTNPSANLDLDTRMSYTKFTSTSWDYAHATYILNQQAGSSVSSAGTVFSFPGSYPFQIQRDYNSNNYYLRGYYSNTGWQPWVRIALSGESYTKAESDSLYLPLAGGWMNWNAQIYFKGLNESTSVYSKIGYATSASGQTMHCVNTAGNQANGAFYITSNGSNSANDTGGLAIDNEGVTVFGAGDAGSNFTGIFRVLNEDNVADGPQFIVTKASGATTKYSHTAQRFISTVATGTQPYTCTSTTLNTNLNADLLDDKHADDFLYRLKRLNLDVSHDINGMFPPAIFELKSAGYPLFADPEFASGNNSFTVYNNSQNGTVTITREQAGDHANSSGYQLKIVTAGTASPNAGGFYQSFTGRANAIFIQLVRAKVPLGYNVNATRNSQGTGSTYTMLTDNKGTGKWEWYAVACYCGTGGSFSNAGFLYLSTNGTVADATNTSVTWYVSYANVFDITKGNYDGLRTRYADSADSISSWAESSGTDYRYVWHSGTGNGAKAAYKSSLTFCPNTGDLKVTSLNANDSTGYTKIYPGYIQIRKNTAANPTANYASIEFSYGSGQNVYIGYTPNDSYRAPAGLKVFGGSGATPAWFEVEGQIISSVATGTAPFVVTSTTKVANLYANKADTAVTLLTNNTSQAADNCYDATPGLHFYRYNGTSSTTGQSGGDGWILQWSWNKNSVGQQLYVDDNPSGIMCIRGCNGTDSSGIPNRDPAFTNWWRLYTDAYHPLADSATYATTAGTANSISWANITGKPINFKAYSGSLASSGWKTLQGRDSAPSIAISYNNSAATWNSETYSASMVWGCSDTRGLLDCGYNTPKVTFGGGSYNGTTDDNPKWYFKIKGTSGTEYDFDSRWSLSTHNHDSIYHPLNGKITRSGGSYSWYQFQQYKDASKNSPSYYSADCAIININSYSGWQPWIRGVASDLASWCIGQYTDALHVARIAVTNTTNTTTNRWDFQSNGNFRSANGFVYGNSTYATSAYLLRADGSVTATSSFASSSHNHDSSYVKKAGDTMTGQLYINYDEDVGLNQSGSLVIGTKAGANIAIDANEIMARSNSSASTLYLNNEGGNVVTGSGNFGIGTSSPSYKLHVTGTVYSTGAPGFYNSVSAGSWSYLRLHNGSNLWDIATKSSSNSGALDFRPGGVDNIGPLFNTNGMAVFSNSGSTSTGTYSEAAVQIREYHRGGSLSDTWGNAPRLAWHWSGRVAAQIGLASNGWLYEAPLTGTNYYRIVCEGSTGVTWGINISGNAATATTATKLGTATVGAANKPIYLNAGTPTAVSSVGEAFLSWGGQNLTGTFGPVDAGIVPVLGANRAAFLSPSAITIEYSTNGGSSWTDYGASDADKINLFNGNTYAVSLRVGKNSTTGVDYTNYRVRVIINTAGQLYTTLNKFVIFCSTNGSAGSWCTIDARLQSNLESNTDTWVTFADQVSISGWSGYNVINTAGFSTYGNTKSSQYGQVRFTFGNTGYSSSYPGLYIINIYCIGGVGWTVPSSMARNNHMYSYDASQNVTFPAKVTASSFIGNASSATIAEDASYMKLYPSSTANYCDSAKGKKHSFNVYALTGSAPTPVSGTAPSTGDGFFMVFNYNDAYVTQIAIDIDPTHKLAIRHWKNDASTWRPWKNILTGANTYVSNGYGIIDGTTITAADTLKTVTRSTSGAHYLTFVDSNNSTAAQESFYTSAKIAFDASTGNLGLGTTSPSQKLHVVGSGRFEGGIGSKGTNGNQTGAYIVHPGGGVYATSTSSVTGYLKITLPQKGKNTMMSFDVTIFTYEGTNQSYTTYHISGYEYSTNGWYEPVTKVYSEGTGTYTNLTVRLGNDGTYACVTIGESNTVWSYPQVTVHNVMTGYGNCDADTWISGWKVEFTTTALTTVVATRSSVNAQNISVPWANITGKLTYAGSDSDGGPANTVKGAYTGSGGKQNPNYFGTNKVGFLMMNTTVNGNSQYKDWIIMDCYSGNDVGGGVALGVNRQSLGAYIMRCASTRTSWDASAELIGTHNYTSYLGYIGTTGVQSTSQTQNLTGIGTVAGSGDYIMTKTTSEDACFAAINSNGRINLLSSGNRGVYNSTGTAGWLITTNGTNSWLNIGNVGIGTSTPSEKLQVAGAVKAYAYSHEAAAAVSVGNSNTTITIGDKKLIPINATGTTAVTLSFTWTGATDGTEAHMIINSSGSSKVINIGDVNSSSANTKKNVAAIVITSGGYGEISILYLDSKYYIRAVGN